MNLFVQQIFAYDKPDTLGICGTKISKRCFFSEKITNLKGEEGC